MFVVFFNDLKSANEILSETDPRQQKSIAKNVANFDETAWNQVSQLVVKKGSTAKACCIYLFFMMPKNIDLYDIVSLFVIQLIHVCFSTRKILNFESCYLQLRIRSWQRQARMTLDGGSAIRKTIHCPGKLAPGEEKIGWDTFSQMSGTN